MASLASRIKKDIEKTQPVDDGTMIRFEVYAEATPIRLSPGSTITYGAIFLGGRWWLSGDKELMGSRKFQHTQFMELLASEAVRKAEVATDFEPVIDEKPMYEPLPAPLNVPGLQTAGPRADDRLDF